MSCIWYPTLDYDPAKILLPSPRVVKEGPICKLGSFRVWRSRYFYLMDDGSLLGFKEKQTKNLKDHIYIFHTKGSKIIKEQKPNAFILRGRVYNTTIIESSFHTETEEEREEWIETIENLKEKMNLENPREDPAFEAAGGSDQLVVSPPESSQQMAARDLHNESGAHQKMNFSRFEIVQSIGHGAFGKVLLVREKDSSKLHALKIIKKRLLRETKEVEHTKNEIKVLMKVDHPFVVHLEQFFTTVKRIFFVLEYVNGGELFHHLQHKECFSENRSMFYAAEICSALGYLHDRKIIYRDLKLENILLDLEGHIKLIDFGLSKDSLDENGYTTSFCGTPEYMAPEMIIEEQYGMSIDWWSFGICMYEMLFGSHPFGDTERIHIYDKIVTEEIQFPRSISGHATKFVRNLLEKNPRKRLGSKKDADEVKESSFFFPINWERLEKRAMMPPFKPSVKSGNDTKYFERQFTRESMDEISPPDSDEDLGPGLCDEFRNLSGNDTETSGTLVGSQSSGDEMSCSAEESPGAVAYKLDSVTCALDAVAHNLDDKAETPSTIAKTRPGRSRRKTPFNTKTVKFESI